MIWENIVPGLSDLQWTNCTLPKPDNESLWPNNHMNFFLTGQKPFTCLPDIPTLTELLLTGNYFLRIFDHGTMVDFRLSVRVSIYEVPSDLSQYQTERTNTFDEI